MSALIGHAKAARIMAESFDRMAVASKDQHAADIMQTLAAGYRFASERMEQAMRDEAKPPTGDAI